MSGIIRKPTPFEVALVAVCVITIAVGYIAINFLFQLDNNIFTWNLLYAVLLWLILIVLFIIAAINEDMKEELGIIIRDQHEEIKLLRKDLTKKSRK